MSNSFKLCPTHFSRGASSPVVTGLNITIAIRQFDCYVKLNLYELLRCISFSHRIKAVRHEFVCKTNHFSCNEFELQLTVYLRIQRLFLFVLQNVLAKSQL